MKIVITGGTGFLGRHLTSHLMSLGHTIILVQRADLVQGTTRLSKLIKSTDCIINLAGSPVIKRWTRKNRKEILDSRLQTTNRLVGAIRMLDPSDRPSSLLSASAIGIYDSKNIHREDSVDFDDNFLASVCRQWESCLEPLRETEVRVCILRIGIVLGKEGGMLKKLLPLFRFGLGGKIGTGEQGFSFIHYLDFCRAVEFLIPNEGCSGIFNMTSPELSTNKLFTSALAYECHRPAFMTVPEMALKLVFGEASVALLKGQLVIPQHLLECGFVFQYPTLSAALRDNL